MAAGTPTDRDGIESAAFASGELTEEAAERKRQSQRISEMGKRLMEACLGAIRADVLMIQDIGLPATSSACEMAARGRRH